MPYATVDPARAENYFKDKMEFTTGPVELQRMMETVNIIDVRAAKDYAESHVPGAKNLPQDKWNTLEGLKKDQTNVIYCYSQVCHLGAKAAQKFASKGFPVMELEGGFEGWKAHKLPTEKTESGVDALN